MRTSFQLAVVVDRQYKLAQRLIAGLVGFAFVHAGMPCMAQGLGMGGLHHGAMAPVGPMFTPPAMTPGFTGQPFNPIVAANQMHQQQMMNNMQNMLRIQQQQAMQMQNEMRAQSWMQAQNPLNAQSQMRAAGLANSRAVPAPVLVPVPPMAMSFAPWEANPGASGGAVRVVNKGTVATQWRFQAMRSKKTTTLRVAAGDSGELDLPSGTYRGFFRHSDSGDDIYRMENISLASGKIATITYPVPASEGNREIRRVE